MLRSKHDRKLRLENLEGRRLMAGDVSVDFDGEKLEIKGDDAANQIAVYSVDGDLIVNGLGSTTINGINDGSAGTNLGPVANLIDVAIETFGGDDRIIVRDLTVADSIEIKAGEGNDTVIARRLRGGNDLKIETEAGVDLVIAAGITFGNSVEFDTGLGADTVRANRITAGNDLKIETKEGNDTVTADRLTSQTGKVLLDGGSAVDQLTLGVVRGELEIKEFEL